MGAPFHPTPTMVSRKVAALEFIKRYIVEWGVSPSIGEIANALGTNRSRISQILHQLASEGSIVRKTGERRNITLPDKVVEAVQLLRRAGYKVNGDAKELVGPHGFIVTNPTLPLLPELDHIPDIEIGGLSDDVEPWPGADDRARRA